MDLWLPVASLAATVVGLYDDARFPGRCIVMLKDHFDHLEEVDEVTTAAVMRDLRLLAAALKVVTEAPRINYAVLGNAEPHVHWHVIPRHPTVEPLPERAPWEDPRPRAKLPARQRQRYLARLSEALRDKDGRH